MEPEADVLRVAFPRACNTQQTPLNHATTSATVTQHVSLKALARKALENNNTRNNRATASLKTTQQGANSDPRFVAQQTALQAFIELVRATGVSKHQLLLNREEIESQVDADDIRELLSNDRAYRQDWAELLAHRLCTARLKR